MTGCARGGEYAGEEAAGRVVVCCGACCAEKGVPAADDAVGWDVAAGAEADDVPWGAGAEPTSRPDAALHAGLVA